MTGPAIYPKLVFDKAEDIAQHDTHGRRAAYISGRTAPLRLGRCVVQMTVLALLLVCPSRPVVGQGSPGFPSFGSLSNGGVDSINLSSLNVHLSIPIVHKAGRRLPLNTVLHYNSTIFFQQTSPCPNNAPQCWAPLVSGWRQFIADPSNHLTDGTNRQFGAAGFATDQSGYFESCVGGLVPVTIQDPSGISYGSRSLNLSLRFAVMTDPNGNTISSALATTVNNPNNTTTTTTPFTATTRVTLNIGLTQVTVPPNL